MLQKSFSEKFSFITLTDERWTSYLNRNSQANIFHQPVWSQLLAESYGFEPFIISKINEEGEIESAIPLLKVKSFLYRDRWVSLPFTDYCTPLFSNQTSLQQITNYLIALTDKQKNLNIELRWDYPDNPKFSKISNFVQHQLKLAPNESEVSNRIKSTHFHRIKIAVESGVRIEWGFDQSCMAKFYQLHLLTRQRKGLPVQPWKFFKLLTQNIIQPRLGFILLAYKEDRCIAGAVFLNWNKTMVYKYSASIEMSRHLHATDLLLWTAIQWGCNNCYEWLDMGRTDNGDEGLKNFKRRWGTEETPVTYSLVSKKNPKPTNGRIMSLMNLIIRNSPPWVCRSAGELLYKHFG